MKFVVAAYGSRGDVEPCAAVGRELLRRGHAVRIAAPPDRLAFIASAGLTAVAYGPDTRGRMDAFAKVVGRIQNPINALSGVMEELSRTWAAKTDTLTSLARGADLVVAGINEQELAANVAESQGIPLAALHFFPPELLSPGVLYSGMVREVAAVQRRGLGLPETGGTSAASLEIQGYDEFCAPGLAASWGEAAARRPFVGALTLQEATDADEEIRAWIAGGPPPICFGLGGTPIASPGETVAMVADACAELGVRALMCSGPNDFGEIPGRDDIKVVSAVNHAAVLPSCRAVIHHGGAGTTAAALRAGIPSVVLWLWLDQPVWAAALERLGVGVGRPFAATTFESLVADLSSVLAPDYAGRAREVATRMTPADQSVSAAADLLEGLAR